MNNYTILSDAGYEIVSTLSGVERVVRNNGGCVVIASDRRGELMTVWPDGSWVNTRPESKEIETELLEACTPSTPEPEFYYRVSGHDRTHSLKDALVTALPHDEFCILIGSECIACINANGDTGEQVTMMPAYFYLGADERKHIDEVVKSALMVSYTCMIREKQHVGGSEDNYRLSVTGATVAHVNEAGLHLTDMHHALDTEMQEWVAYNVESTLKKRTYSVGINGSTIYRKKSAQVEIKTMGEGEFEHGLALVGIWLKEGVIESELRHVLYTPDVNDPFITEVFYSGAPVDKIISDTLGEMTDEN